MPDNNNIRRKAQNNFRRGTPNSQRIHVNNRSISNTNTNTSTNTNANNYGKNYRLNPNQDFKNHHYKNQGNANIGSRSLDQKNKIPTGPKGMPRVENSNYYPPAPPQKRSLNTQQNLNRRKRLHVNNINEKDAEEEEQEEEEEEEEEEDVFDKLSNKDKIPKFAFMTKVKEAGPSHERIQLVGEGTYGKVYKAKNKITGELVALKRLRLESEREGFPITSHREIGLLQSFNHRNIAGLYEMMVESNQVFMVFEYMSHDLSGILQQGNIIITDGEKKNMFKQLLEGIGYLHSKRVIHRDIKGSNILISKDGILKITDFGLARKMKNINTDLVSPNYTNRVITLWYRPPDILLGSTNYGMDADIWGIGCLFIELFTRRAIFQGINEIDQLWRIYSVMGTINSKDWPNADKLPWFELLRPDFHSTFKFRDKFGSILSNEGFNLATELLQMNPLKRITAKAALSHAYFEEEPKAAPLNFLNTIKGEWHEFEAKQKRRQKSKEQQSRPNTLNTGDQ
ncbi:cyclin-dependent serine/threonine protein kinase [Martiniozyma asiatica (nom. inval.)]|nr:cyclin-dependent serine/threonine protein kinase [Martiniozyma asiatica]